MLSKETIESTAAKSATEVKNDQELRVPCYCEENVWRLAHRRINNKKSNIENEPKRQKKNQIQKISTNEESSTTNNTTTMHDYVVFISNPLKACPMYRQKACKNKDYVCWDYHVILLSSSKNITSANEKEVLSNKNNSNVDNIITNVHDIDSVLPYPCSLDEYIKKSFCFLYSEHVEDECKTKYAPWFRLIKSDLFLKYFYSDRLHMFDEKNGIWQADPPLYDCIMIGKKYDDDNNNKIDEYNDGKSASNNESSSTIANHNSKSTFSNLEMYINIDVVDNVTTVESSSSKKYGIVLNIDSIRRLFEI